jgi:hypothetical protein
MNRLLDIDMHPINVKDVIEKIICDFIYENEKMDKELEHELLYMMIEIYTNEK